jgi:predicted ester cyclase
MAFEQDNGAIVRRFLDLVWNRGELSAIDDLVDDNFTNFGVRQPGGHAGMRHIVTVWRTAFPDLHFEIQEEIVHDDKVVTRGLARGTHLGEFQQGVGPGRIMGTMALPAGRSKQTRSTSGAARRKDRRAFREPKRSAALEPARAGVRYAADHGANLAQAGDPRFGAARLSLATRSSSNRCLTQRTTTSPGSANAPPSAAACPVTDRFSD